MIYKVSILENKFVNISSILAKLLIEFIYHFNKRLYFLALRSTRLPLGMPLFIPAKFYEKKENYLSLNLCCFYQAVYCIHVLQLTQ